MYNHPERINEIARLIFFVIVCLAIAMLIFAITVIADGLSNGNVIFVAHIQQPVITPTELITTPTLPTITPTQPVATPTLPAITPTPTAIR